MTGQETALVQMSDIDRLFALDKDITSANAVAVVERTISMWNSVHLNGALCEVWTWGIIYSFRMTVITSGEHAGKAKWQVAQLDPRYALALTWEEFCLHHLDMGPSEASNKKRNWEIYKIELGYGLIDLLIAGVQRLNVARSTMIQCMKGSPVVFPEKLLVAVFGEPHICTKCGAHTYFTEAVPKACPHCAQDYQYREPATVADVKAIIEELKGAPGTKPHVEGDVEESDDALTVLPFFIGLGWL